MSILASTIVALSLSGDATAYVNCSSISYMERVRNVTIMDVVGGRPANYIKVKETPEEIIGLCDLELVNKDS